MTLLSSILSCCNSVPSAAKTDADADARHARIANAIATYQSPHRPSYHRPRSLVHDDNPPLYTDIAHTALLRVDEKCDVPEAHTTFRTLDDDNTPPPPLSPRSSVVSIPSTRLTDLTAMPTGETISYSVLGRGSLERWASRPTRPPSYVDTMPRAPSPVASVTRLSGHNPPLIGVQGEQAGVWSHPVMHSGWLQELQREAAAEEVRTIPRTPQR
ncbi:hypothetical protein PV10_02458 [Exophiala mesophila]|uniref:Uncharacterized protein n=1 Tax=Exophiala mesophila TaxID=212818 RepID=A0A0D1WYZ3_EXOME|nr:uncharacterized protein PV10_02458 [Exophiala mesophila]KIV94720.1 hypothetical protein PV10_02458 [Exophiala mesophila]